jgi:hypothetical protein
MRLRNRLKTLLCLLAVTTTGTSRVNAQAAAGPLGMPPSMPSPRDSTLPTLFHIGDSTVRNGSGTGANVQWGWGLTKDPVGAYLLDEAAAARSCSR